MSYKNWKILYKILFAAIAPFLIALIISLPFNISNSIKDSESIVKAYSDEVSYGTALSIQLEVDKQIRELNALVYFSRTSTNNSITKELLEAYFGAHPHLKTFSAQVRDTNNNIISQINATKVNGTVNYDNNITHMAFDDEDTDALLLQNNKEIDIQIQKAYHSNTSNTIYVQSRSNSITIQESLNELKDYDLNSFAIYSDSGKSYEYIKHNATAAVPNFNALYHDAINTNQYKSVDTQEDFFKKNYNLFTPIKFEGYGHKWLLLVSYSLESARTKVIADVKNLWPIVLMCFGFGLAVSALTAKNIAEPITEVSTALDKISGGEYTYNLPQNDSTDEIGQMLDAATVFKSRMEELAIAKQSAESANVAKSEFLANMSHELRTPMHAMLSYAQLGLDKIEDKESKLFKYLTNIHTSGGRLLRLLNDLLDLSKLESGKAEFHFKRTDINTITEILKNEFRALLDSKELKLNVSISTHNPTIVCDSEKMTQVFVNILSNAIKFSPTKSQINFNAYDTEEGLLISIEDGGDGIPENELESIFDKFIQSSKTNKGAGGTGLGLSIARSIMNSHDGKIWAENRSEGGARFCILMNRNLKDENV